MRLRDVRPRTLLSTRKFVTPVLVATALMAGAASPLLATSSAAAQTTTGSDAGTGSVALIQPAAVQAEQRPIDRDAAFYVNLARGTLQQADALKIDTTQFGVQIAQLSDSESLPQLTVDAFVSQLRATTGNFSAKIAKKQASDAKAKAAAAAARKAATKHAAKITAGNSPDAARANARSIMAAEYGWGAGEFQCLNSLWNKESGWNYKAYNADGGATGIPQALPGSKMAAAGSDWAGNATTQIKWGLSYINASYGSACSAWSHSQAMNWY